MSKQCVHKDDKEQQCTELVETGLFCEKHSAQGSKAKSRSGGRGGPGWDRTDNIGSSVMRYLETLIHHGPPGSKG